jgi:hypothetical protein
MGAILAVALLCAAPTATWALTPYSQDFEALDQQAPNALANDGWVTFVNVFGPDWAWWYNYPGGPAPNGGPRFSGIDIGQGGPAQGDQQLVIYNDYQNFNHGDGSNAIIEVNVFQEQMVDAADVGKTWRFSFDAKRGNIELASMAGAFIKTLDPAQGYLLTNFLQVPTTDLPYEWGSFQVDIFVDAGLEGQILQFGFINWASRYEGSGIFYDNLSFGVAPVSVSLDIRPEGCPNPLQNASRGLLPVAVLGTADFNVADIDVASLRLEGVAPVRWDYEDEATPYGGELCGCTEEGSDGWTDLTLKFDAPALTAVIGAPSGSEVVLNLTGALLDGTPIEGQDCAIVVGRAMRPGIEDRPLSGDNSLQPVDTERKGDVSRPSVRKTRIDGR